MTPRDIFRNTVQHTPAEKFLYYAGFTRDLRRRVADAVGVEEGALADHFGFFSWNSQTLRRPEEYALPDYRHYFEEIEQPTGCSIDANGCLHVPGSEHHFTRYISPLRNASSLRDIESYPWTDWSRYEREHIAAQVAATHARGMVASVRCTHMYEDAWQVRGYEEFLMDMLTEPGWAHRILDYFKERNLRAAVAAAEAGADVFVTGDDVANQKTLMFSIDTWREFIRDKWAEVYATAKGINPDIAIWYHSDGNITDIIPELIEIGVDIFNPLQPECVDLPAIKQRYGKRIVMDGTIGTQTTMPFGAADDVRACVRERVATLGRDGALILSPTHVLEPEVPIENILAFVDACRDEAGRAG